MSATEYSKTPVIGYMAILATDGPEYFRELMDNIPEGDYSWVQQKYTIQKIQQKAAEHGAYIPNHENRTGSIDHLRETGACFPLSSMTSAPVILLGKNEAPSPHAVYISSDKQAKNIKNLSQIKNPAFSSAFKKIGAKDFRDVTPEDIGQLMTLAPNHTAKEYILDMVMGMIASHDLLLNWGIPNLAGPQLPKSASPHPKLETLTL